MPDENLPPHGPQPPGAPAPPPPPAPPAAAESSFWRQFLGSVIHPYSLFGVLAIGGVAFIFWAIGRSDGGFLRSIQDVDTARGLITFLIAITTIVIALILALYPLISGEEQAQVKERFGLGKEVLAALIGVLGTIVGFYFGSGEKAVAKLDLAPLRIVGTQVATHVIGGVAPYRYSVKYGDRTIDNKVSADGWILESLGETPRVGARITVETTDSKDQRVTRHHDVRAGDLQGESGTPAANPPPAGSPGARSTPEGRPPR